MPTVAEILTLAVQHHQAGRLQEAKDLYEQILSAHPESAEAWHRLGVLAYQVGQPAAALEFLRRAMALDRVNADYPADLGDVYLATGKAVEAAACFQEALRLRPDWAEVYAGYAHALLQQGKRDEAILCYRQLLRLQPENVAAHANLGNLLHGQGRTEEALAAYRESVRLQPDYAEGHYNLGNALLDQGKLAEAEACYREALRWKPTFAAARNNLGVVLMKRSQLDDAEAEYRKAAQLQPTSAEAHNNLGAVLLLQNQTEAAAECFHQALRFRPVYFTAHSNLLFCLNHDPDLEPKELFAEHCRWGEIHERAVAPLPPQAPVLDPQRRLRVGYVSANCGLPFFEPILANHDPAQVETFCYTDVYDAETARVQALSRHVRRSKGRSDREVAEMVRADGIDILVDLAGHSATTRIGVFLYKSAPIQVTYLGYPNTTGLTRMDYKLTDAVLDPPDNPEAGKWNTEKLAYLSGVVCYAPPTNAPEVTPLPALKSGRFTFGSMHRLAKLNEKVFDLWAEILHAVPGSRLLMFRDSLHGKVRERVRQAFLKRGIDDSRLDLRHHAGPEGYFPIYGEIDLCLDVFPWTGGTTTCESLWMGVPILALNRGRHIERVTAALLNCAGILEAFSAPTPEAYVALAARWADDRDRLAAMRLGMREQMRATICDGRRFTRALEEVYREMWRRKVVSSR